MFVGHITGHARAVVVERRLGDEERGCTSSAERICMYDLLLKGGRVIDPAQDLDAARDLALEHGQVAAIASAIGESEARQVLDVKGKIVTPGLIDLHAHVFDGVTRNGVAPDLAGVHAGVTTVVDAGSAGSATVDAFPRYILPNSETEVLPFLHICQTGLAPSRTSSRRQASTWMPRWRRSTGIPG